MLALYVALRGKLVDYAQSIVRDRALAEDVVQDAWLRLTTLAEGRVLEDPVGYLYRIVRNLALDGRRRSIREEGVIRHEPVTTLERAADASASPELTAAAKDELRLLSAAMAELPERIRIALEMRRFGGCKLKEIADHLGVSVATAHELIAQGLAYCRRRVRP